MGVVFETYLNRKEFGGTFDAISAECADAG
jgi:hypothetical protein